MSGHSMTWTPFAACGGQNFWQIEGDEASRFTAFVTDMALVTCFVWRATRLVCDGTLGGSETLPKRGFLPLFYNRTLLSSPYVLGGRSRSVRTAPVRLGWSIFRFGSFVS